MTVSFVAGQQIDIIEIQREPNILIKPLPDVILNVGDRIRIQGAPQNLKELESAIGASLYDQDTPVDEEHPLRAEDQQIAEIVITQGSPLLGSTFSVARLKEKYQFLTLAFNRSGADILSNIKDLKNVRLRIGDVLLVQGSLDQISKIKREGKLLVLDASVELPHLRGAPIALMIMVRLKPFYHNFQEILR